MMSPIFLAMMSTMESLRVDTFQIIPTRLRFPSNHYSPLQKRVKLNEYTREAQIYTQLFVSKDVMNVTTTFLSEEADIDETSNITFITNELADAIVEVNQTINEANKSSCFTFPDVKEDSQQCAMTFPEVAEENNTEIKQEIQSLPFSKSIEKRLTEPRTEVADALLILLSSLLVAVGTLPVGTLPPETVQLNYFLEELITDIFFVQYMLRFYSIGQLKPKFLTTPLSIIDIFVIVLPFLITSVLPLLARADGPFETLIDDIPNWLMSTSGLVNLRLLRILRLQRVTYDIETFTDFAQALGIKAGDVRPWFLQLSRVLVSVFTLCSVSTGLIYAAEHAVNPQIPDYFTALYFGLTTLTTVGFGDIVPVTAQGRFIVSATILVGVVVIPAQAASFIEALLGFQDDRRKEKKMENLSRQAKQLRTISKNLSSIKIDPRRRCDVCGVDGHRRDSLFCWSCGSRLEKRNIDFSE